MRRPVVFEEATNEDEKLLIHKEAILFTSNEAIEPVKTLKMASARDIYVQQFSNFVPFSDPNLFVKLFPHLFPLDLAIQGQSEK